MQKWKYCSYCFNPSKGNLAAATNIFELSVAIFRVSTPQKEIWLRQLTAYDDARKSLLVSTPQKEIWLRQLSRMSGVTINQALFQPLKRKFGCGNPSDRFDAPLGVHVVSTPQKEIWLRQPIITIRGKRGRFSFNPSKGNLAAATPPSLRKKGIVQMFQPLKRKFGCGNMTFRPLTCCAVPFQPLKRKFGCGNLLGTDTYYGQQGVSTPQKEIWLRQHRLREQWREKFGGFNPSKGNLAAATRLYNNHPYDFAACFNPSKGNLAAATRCA